MKTVPLLSVLLACLIFRGSLAEFYSKKKSEPKWQLLPDARVLEIEDREDSFFDEKDVGESGDDPRWSNGDLRLTGEGHTNSSGRLEIFIQADYQEGVWGSVCGDSFTLREATVACRQLGYQSASEWYYAAETQFGAANYSTPIFLSGMKCSSKNMHTLRCKHDDIGTTSDCEHDNDVAIFCNTDRVWGKPYKGQVRLVSDDLVASRGRVEVYQAEQWGTVCGSQFAESAADSVCRQLGYTSALSFSRTTKPGEGIIWVDDISCGNSKACFTSCFKAHKPSHRCNHTQDIEVHCTFDSNEQKVNSAGSKSKCRIRGFRIALLIVVICLTLSALLVLGATIALCLVFVCGCRKRCSRRYEQLG